MEDPSLTLKRIIDVAGATCISVLTAPLMAGIAIAIKLESRGPVLFTQLRAGLHDRPFRIYKFRTMSNDGDRGQPLRSLDDPRVTRLGRHLRRTSLDELPQLFNVLKGEMSLVGPRPQLPGTTRAHEARRLDMRPGMTGLVEISRPERMTWDERMAMDVEYVERWSLRLDFMILLRTVRVMFARKNALDPPRDEEDAVA